MADSTITQVFKSTALYLSYATEDFDAVTKLCALRCKLIACRCERRVCMYTFLVCCFLSLPFPSSSYFLFFTYSFPFHPQLMCQVLANDCKIDTSQDTVLTQQTETALLCYKTRRQYNIQNIYSNRPFLAP